MAALPRLILHICCAPDATVPWAELSGEFEVLGYFYGSNIHPADEYGRRRGAVEKFMSSVNGRCVYPAPFLSAWLSPDEMETLAGEPEGGARCARCFRLQLERTADAAVEFGCSHVCTTLTISPHKDAALINSIGRDAAKELGLTWVERVFRKNNGFLNSVRISKSLGLYRQNYCGCVFSVRP